MDVLRVLNAGVDVEVGAKPLNGSSWLARHVFKVRGGTAVSVSMKGPCLDWLDRFLLMDCVTMLDDLGFRNAS